MDPAYPGFLRPGDWVQIAGTGSCLNIRSGPGVPSPAPDGQTYDNVVNCLPDGFIGWLESSVWGDKTSLPVQVDGRWWWPILGQGWAAEEWLTFHHQGGIPWPGRPDLANAGLIAYVGVDNDIWVINADGTGQRQIMPRVDGQSVNSLEWAPQGGSLAFSSYRWDATGSTIATRIIDPGGAHIAEIPGLSEPRWSPAGDRLSALRVARYGDMGGYYGTPVTIELATGAEVALGPENFYMASPVWSPDGSSLAFICTSATYTTYEPDGTSVTHDTDCGGDGLRIASLDGSSRVALPMDAQNGPYFGNPFWSPAGNTIAVVNHDDSRGCRGYTMVDVATGTTGACLPFPPLANIGGRCGGSAEMDASDWSPDGSRFIFHAQGAGQSGVFVTEVATGARTIIPNSNPQSVSVASDNRNLVFSGAGGIWVAGLDGSNLTLLADGHSPAWQPLP